MPWKCFKKGENPEVRGKRKSVHLYIPLPSQSTTTTTGVPQLQEHNEHLLINIQRLSKLFKGHRCVFDFERGFVNTELIEAEPAPEEQEEDDDDEQVQ
jgi:hypothetical protein